MKLHFKQQTTTTDAGTVMESITAFNLLVALVIVGSITYALVRNISVQSGSINFSSSRESFTRYAQQQIMTLLTYILSLLVVIQTLGMSGQITMVICYKSFCWSWFWYARDLQTLCQYHSGYLNAHPGEFEHGYH